MTDNELIGDKTSPRVIGAHLIPTLEFKGLVRMFVPELFWGGVGYGGRIYRNLEMLSLNCGPQMCGGSFLYSCHLMCGSLPCLLPPRASLLLGSTAWLWLRQG